MFNLSARKPSNHQLLPTKKIGPDTNLQKTYTNMKQKMFEELVPSVLPLLKKKLTYEARTRWYRRPFRRFIDTKTFF